MCKRWGSQVVPAISEQPRVSMCENNGWQEEKASCFDLACVGQVQPKIRGGQALRRPWEGAWGRNRSKAKPCSEGRFLQRQREA